VSVTAPKLVTWSVVRKLVNVFGMGYSFFPFRERCLLRQLGKMCLDGGDVVVVKAPTRESVIVPSL
jgi:hypothetical protein